MKGHLLVSHRILDLTAQAQVFASAGPVFGVNEESISAVSPRNFQERGKSLFEPGSFGDHSLPPPVLYVACWLWIGKVLLWGTQKTMNSRRTELNPVCTYCNEKVTMVCMSSCNPIAQCASFHWCQISVVMQILTCYLSWTHTVDTGERKQQRIRWMSREVN